MKSGVIRKHSRYRVRCSSHDTSSVSPGALRRPSPSATGGPGNGASSAAAANGTGSPHLAEASTTQPAYCYSQEDYDFGSSTTTTSELLGALGGGGGAHAGCYAGVQGAQVGPYSSIDYYDCSLTYAHSSAYLGPYRPDYLLRRSPTSYYDNTLAGNGDQGSKRRRLSIDSVSACTSELPSSAVSSFMSGYATSTGTGTATDASSVASAASSSRSHGQSAPEYVSAYTFGPSFWHSPMLPSADRSSVYAFTVHPPMLPPSSGVGNDSGAGAGAGGGDFEFPHQPMLPPPGSVNSGSNADAGVGDHDLFARYLHPSMVYDASESPRNWELRKKKVRKLNTMVK